MKSKQFISGLIMGTILASSVGVFASGAIISATKTDDTHIYIDGQEIELEDGYAILNYEGHVYTSARTIAEGLDADVSYLADNNQKNIYITSNTDTDDDTDVDTDVDDNDTDDDADVDDNDTDDDTDVDTDTDDDIDYRLPPLKDSALGVEVYVMAADIPYDETEIDVVVSNNNKESRVMFTYSDFKLIDEDGEEYSVKNASSSDDTMFYNSIPAKTEDKTETLKFPELDAGEKVTLEMPFKRYNVDGSTEKDVIEIPLIIEDYDID